MEQQVKVWAQGAFGTKKMFPNGGSIIQLDLKLTDFIAWANANVNDKGYVKLKISGSREPRLDERGNEKLNIELDTWKPTPQAQQGYQVPQQGYQQPQQAPQPQGYQQPQQPQAPQGYDPSMQPPQYPQV